MLRVDRSEVDQCPLGISRKLYRNLALALARRLRETNELVCASRSNSTLENEPKLGRLVSVQTDETGGDAEDGSVEQEGLERDRLLAYWRTLRGESAGRKSKDREIEKPVVAVPARKGRSYADVDDSLMNPSGNAKGRGKKRR